MTTSFPTRRSSDRTRFTFCHIAGTEAIHLFLVVVACNVAAQRTASSDEEGIELVDRLLIIVDVARIDRLGIREFVDRRIQSADTIKPYLGRVLEPFLRRIDRSEEHTSELQSLMRNSYVVLCLKTKTKT